MKITAKRAIIFSIAHALLTIICLILALDFTPIDTGGDRSLVSVVAGFVVSILLIPGRIVWNSWAIRNLPNIFEWIIFLCNSAMWGIFIDYVYSKLKKTYNKRLHKGPQKACGL
jgi:hypothetical protein